MSALELLRRLDAEATPGPWEARDFEPAGQPGWAGVIHPNGWVLDGACGTPSDLPDARLIATMRTLLPELIELLKVQPVCLCDRFDDQHDVDCPAAETLNALAALDAKAATMENDTESQKV